MCVCIYIYIYIYIYISYIDTQTLTFMYTHITHAHRIYIHGPILLIWKLLNTLLYTIYDVFSFLLSFYLDVQTLNSFFSKPAFSLTMHYAKNHQQKVFLVADCHLV